MEFRIWVIELVRVRGWEGELEEKGGLLEVEKVDGASFQMGGGGMDIAGVGWGDPAMRVQGV